MSGQRASNEFRIKVDGREIPQEVRNALLEVTIEDEVNLPDSCEIVFRDPLRSVLRAGGFEVGKELEVAVVSEGSPGGEPIFAGEITAVEAEIERDATRTVIRGYDVLHRLQRGTHTETYLDSTYGDIVSTVARRHGLSTDDTGSNRVVHEAVVQFNQTDWEFLTELARRIGHELVVVDGNLALRTPGPADSGPGEGDLDSRDARQLVVGSNILQLRAALSGGEQVTEVNVRGWDYRTKEPVEGTVTTENSSDSAAAGSGAADLAQALDGGTLVMAERPIDSAEVATNEAESLAQQLGSAACEIDGMVFGNPALKAGVAVSLAGAGQPFDGRYTLTSCRHTYDGVEGYRTAFRVSGRQNRTMLGVIGSTTQGRAEHGVGVSPAVVTDVDDPDGLGRVKVAFPWLGDSAQSFWARVMTVGAGNERGFYVLPEIDDEVLVAFHQGDAGHPFVLGGLYNGVDAPPVQAVESGRVERRALVTRKGHKLLFDDLDDVVTLASSDEEHKIVIDQQNRKISIETSGELEITTQSTVKFDATGPMTLESAGALEIKGNGVKIDAGGGAFEAKGATAKVEGQGSTQVSGGALTEITGALVKIN